MKFHWNLEEMSRENNYVEVPMRNFIAVLPLKGSLGSCCLCDKTEAGSLIKFLGLVFHLSRLT